MATENIIHVNETDFEYEVVGYSTNVPVIVDFWAKWCIPCRTLSPALEKLVKEANGAVRLAKVDVDENPNLAMRFGVRSIPSVKAFSQGQVVAEFTGLQPEPVLREFFEKVVPSPASLMLEKANSLLLLHQWSSAEETFRKLLDETPDLRPVAQLGLAKSLLGQGSGDEALFILRNFSPAESTPRLRTCARWRKPSPRMETARKIPMTPLLQRSVMRSAWPHGGTYRRRWTGCWISSARINVTAAGRSAR